jgi:hypothetical protein
MVIVILSNVQMDAHLRVFDVLFLEHLPALHAHFASIGVSSDMYLLDWFITLFTRSLPLDVAARVWDAFLVLDEVPMRSHVSVHVCGLCCVCASQFVLCLLVCPTSTHGFS